MQTISNAALADGAAFLAACTNAQRRARHSYFTQYVITDGELGYLAVDEGDYSPMPMEMIDRVVYAVTGDLDDGI
jgi:hypothetical protein